MKCLLQLLFNFVTLSSAFPPDRKDRNGGNDLLAQVGSPRVLLTTGNEVCVVQLLPGPSNIANFCRVQRFSEE